MWLILETQRNNGVNLSTKQKQIQLEVQPLSGESWVTVVLTLCSHNVFNYKTHKRFFLMYIRHLLLKSIQLNNDESYETTSLILFRCSVLQSFGNHSCKRALRSEHKTDLTWFHLRKDTATSWPWSP